MLKRVEGVAVRQQDEEIKFGSDFYPILKVF